MVKKIKLYSADWCPHCVAAKEYFEKNKIEFENFDIEKDKKYVEEAREKSGQTGIPVIEIGGEIIIGFDKEKIEKALK